MNRASWHEWYLYLHNRPLTTLVMHATARWGRCVHLPTIGYLVNDPELALQILNHEAFTTHGKGGMDGLITALLGDKALLNMDGPAHRELRRQLHDLFSKRGAEGVVEQAAGPVLARLRADLLAGRQVDLVPVIHQVTSRTACAVLGIPVDPRQAEAVHAEITHLAERLTAFLGLDKQVSTPEMVRRARPYFDRLLAFAEVAYREAGDDDRTVIPRLKRAGWTFEETKGLIAVMLTAGTETVSAALPRIVALLLDTGQMARLTADRARLPRVVDEGLRMVCPSPAITRGLDQDVEIDGVPFRRGRRIVIVLVNTLKNRDHFPHGWTFDPDRASAPRYKNLAFGGGPHFCIGFNLADREITLVLETLLNVGGRLRIIERRYPRGMSFPTYTRLILQREAR
jgi:cytochrome P450